MAKTETYRKWTENELYYLRVAYDDTTAELIAKTLGRTLDSIWSKAEAEGLKKKRKAEKRDLDGPWLCSSCDKIKPKEDFGRNGSRGSTYCRNCTSLKQRERRKRNDLLR